MVRRLPWTHPNLKVAYTVPGRNTPASESTSNMASRTPRGRKLVYNNSGSSAKSSWRNRYTPGAGGGAGGGGGFGGTPSSQKQRLDGLFLEGNWYCNCEPRGLASYLRVAKNTKNKGRFFYTCPKGRKGGCDFFLWSEDAENRAGSGSNTMNLPPMPDDTFGGGGGAEETTPMKPPRGAASSLPTPSMTAPATRQRSMGEFVSTQKPVETTPSRTAAKRKRVLFEFDDDDDEDELFGNVSSDEERQMFEVMQSSAKKLGPPGTAAAAAPAAPAAAAPATPSTRRTAHAETPATVSRTLFPEAKRRKPDDGAVSFGSASTTSSGTAVPSSPPPPPGGTPGEEQLDPTAEVLDLLRAHKVEDAAALRDVRAALQKFALKAKGVARGRDSVRTALKKKDERIADLQERVASLENRNRVQKEQIEDFKAGIMDLYSKH
ncbi:hypothetical protein CTRI78_v001396 [Colletotrichum trifolii]|uniref:GRF-type domain-containing protein n=1 Tax=Colletotrichum trifolii TaxID=5466 RepID=A0A4R8RZ94_COLTR|nr:hypothetical protein CTRI78_v001396 [Colletotrichum trifolii]